jgi:hypothetical protein
MTIASVAALGSALALCCLAGASDAQIFISATGNDANICSRMSPCRTLQRGIDATGAGRVMTLLNSGEYGPTATIEKSITIVADGVSATVRSLAAGSTAITIDNSSAPVVLRGLLVTGGGTGQRGIDIADALAVHIVGCQVERFTQQGVRLDMDAAELHVADTISRDNGSHGLHVLETGLNSRLVVDNSRFENNGGDGVNMQDADAAILAASARAMPVMDSSCKAGA